MPHPEFVIVNEENEKALRIAVESSPQRRVEVQSRLDELQALKNAGRLCHASDTQRNFLQRVLGQKEE